LRLRKTLEDAKPEERAAVLEEHLREQLGRVLRLPASSIERRAPFSSFGVDSLTSLELRNHLESGLGLKLEATLLFTYPHLASLTEHLLAGMGLSAGRDPDAASGARAGPRDASGDLEALTRLTERDAEALLEEELASLEDYLK
jgi:acyl carrier protein